MLAAQNLTLVRGGRTVLEGMNFGLRPGEITAILGPNGAGKSTLLAALAGLIVPVSGGVTTAATPMEKVAATDRARRIGYLPQAGEVAWNLSVRALAGLGRLPWRGSSSAAEDVAAVDRALAAMDLTALANRSALTLSGGERARALLARVLATGAGWVLADEPLAALDLAHQLALTAHFRALADEGKGVVLVLHDLALAMNHADRVVVLGEGRVIADGPPVEALTPAVIARVWNVDVAWLGDRGAQALVVRGG
jgi:iron complex transport system ATP-binding protein